MKRALITGIAGQDGSYLAELLLQKGYEVHGIVRRIALEDPLHRMWRITNFTHQLHLHAASMENFPSLYRVLSEVQPEEIYHLAGQSFVGHEAEDEFSTLESNIHGTHYMLASFRDVCPGARFYFAASSEMFGSVNECPQTESTPFHPRSAYGISKCAGYHLTRSYRELYGLFSVAGISFNHESPRRGLEFVTRKIAYHVALISQGKIDKLRLGNLDARRDWGHARRYVDAMWRMLQQNEPKDYVIATGRSHTVRELCEIAFGIFDLDYENYVETDPQLYRPTEVGNLVGDPSKAAAELGWSNDVTLQDLMSEMVHHDAARTNELESPEAE